MATTSLELTRLVRVVAPRLIAAPVQYDSRFIEQFANTLRLYFNQNDVNFAALTGDEGGRFLNFPYAAIQRTTDKTFVANTATEITFDTSDFLNGCANDGTNGILVDRAGIYNYQFSVQYSNTDSQAHTAWVWLRVNNTDVAGTGSQFSIPSKHGSTNGHLIAAANFYVQLNAGDYVKMYAAVDVPYVPSVSQGVLMEAYPALTTPFAMPAIPSVVATLSFVSSIPT